MDKNQPEIVSMLGRYGIVERSSKPILKDPRQPQLGYISEEDQGKADLIATGNGYGFAVECKCGEAGFSLNPDDLSGWRANQREWAAWYRTTTRCEYWLALRLGVDPPHYDRDRYAPKRTWLVPYPTMIALAERLAPIQWTLPYRLGKQHRLDLRAQQLSAVDQLGPFELAWRKGGWQIPDAHPFSKIYLQKPGALLWEVTA